MQNARYIVSTTRVVCQSPLPETGNFCREIFRLPTILTAFLARQATRSNYFIITNS